MELDPPVSVFLEESTCSSRGPKLEQNVKVEMDWQEEEETLEEATTVPEEEEPENVITSEEEQARRSNLRVELEDVLGSIESGKYGTVKVARLRRKTRRIVNTAKTKKRTKKKTETQRKRNRQNRLWEHQCSVAGCKSRLFAVRHFNVPAKNMEQRRLWTEALNKPAGEDGKQWKPTLRTKVCSDHFLSGQPSATRLDPDYVPSIFPWNDKKRPRTAKEMKEYEEMKRKVRQDVEEVIKKKFLTFHSPIRLAAAKRIAEGRGFEDDEDLQQQPSEKKPRLLLTTSSSAKASYGHSRVQVAAERARSKDVLETVKMREKQLEEMTTKFNDYRTSFTKMLKENTSLKQKVTFLEQRLNQSEATNKQMMARCDELSAYRDRKVKMTFRGTQTRVVDHEEDAAVFSDDDRVEMSPLEWVKHLKRSYRVMPLPERRAMEMQRAEEKGELDTYLRRMEERKEMYKRMRRERLLETTKVPTTRTLVAKTSSSSSSPPKRLLQSVDPTKVPDSVRQAVQSMLLKGSLQPVRVQTVPLAVQRAVSQMMIVQQQEQQLQNDAVPTQVVIRKMEEEDEEDEIGGHVSETVLVLEAAADEPLRTPVHTVVYD